MQHVLAPPVKPQTTFHQGKVRAVARAYGGLDPHDPTPQPFLRFDLKGTVTGATHQWELGHLTQTMEWEPPGFVPQDSGMTMGTGKIGSTVNVSMEGQQLFYNRTLPYLTGTHWVRLSAKLQEFETYEESVVFHNVSVFKTKDGGRYLVGSGPQTVTTPSGVTVTLDDVQHKPNFSGSWGGEGYCLHLLYPQATLLPSLPHSPLWRKYQSAVRVSADIPKPYDSGGSSYSVTDGTYNFRMSKPLPPTLPTFRVIVRQRVDLSSVPMTFTLPVGTKPPKAPL